MMRSSVVLPGAGGPEQREQLAVGHVEAHVVDGEEGPKVFTTLRTSIDMRVLRTA